MLRRQMRRSYRQPLISFNSKRLLRYRPATSSIEEFGEGLRFRRMIPEQNTGSLKPAQDIRKVVLCSGQVYYDIVDKRKELNKDDIAVIRVEQLAPFP